MLACGLSIYTLRVARPGETQRRGVRRRERCTHAASLGPVRTGRPARRGAGCTHKPPSSTCSDSAAASSGWQKTQLVSANSCGRVPEGIQTLFWAEQRASAAQGTSARGRRAAAAHTTHLVRAVDHLERRHGGWSRSRRLEAARPTPSQTAGSAHRLRRREVAACCCGHSRLRRGAHSATLDKVCEASVAVCFSLSARITTSQRRSWDG